MDVHFIGTILFDSDGELINDQIYIRCPFCGQTEFGGEMYIWWWKYPLIQHDACGGRGVFDPYSYQPTLIGAKWKMLRILTAEMLTRKYKIDSYNLHDEKEIYTRTEAPSGDGTSVKVTCSNSSSTITFSFMGLHNWAAGIDDTPEWPMKLQPLLEGENFGMTVTNIGIYRRLCNIDRSNLDVFVHEKPFPITFTMKQLDESNWTDPHCAVQDTDIIEINHFVSSLYNFDNVEQILCDGQSFDPTIFTAQTPLYVCLLPFSHIFLRRRNKTEPIRCVGQFLNITRSNWPKMIGSFPVRFAPIAADRTAICQ